MLLGRIVGKVSTTNFNFLVSNEARKFQFIQMHHPEYNYVLGQIMELERTEQEMLARCNVIGYKDNDGRIRGIRTPFKPGTEVLVAEDKFIEEVIKLEGEGGFLGYLEGKRIPIKVDLQKILTKHLCVLAKSGSGKSYAVGVLLEEIMEKNVPLLIIDPHGEYSSMKYPNDEEKDKLAEYQLSPKGYSLNIQEYGDINTNENLRPLKLNEKMSSYELMKLLPLQLTNTQEAILFSVIKDLEEINLDNILLGLEQLNSSGKWSLMDTIKYLRDLKLFATNFTEFNELITPGKCSIINLRGVMPEIQDIIVSKLLKDLFLARKQEKIPPFFCILEEAHNFCPEKGFGKAKSSETIRLISSEGRKFGMGLCVISQRPALVQKSVLAQCSTQLIMKITNPNDLRAVIGSIEGITSDTENEIQNLPVGSALVCGIVDRPLVTTIRPRRSKHGGQAVDVLGSSEEYQKDVIKETKTFDEKILLPIIKPKLTVKDIKLMATREIKKITTFLIPAVFVTCTISENHYSFLIDKIKGKIILNPETDSKKDISEISPENCFLRKPTYENIDYDVKIEERITTEKLITYIKKPIQDYKDCFIIYYKIEY